jgi:NADPH-dependent curcumin reductase CurA
MRAREIRLKARPQGLPRESDFELAEVDVAEPADGELLIRNELMSVDPYMRGRMNDTRSYVPPFALGKALDGGAVGRVVASRHRGFSEGDWVFSMLGWREVARSDGAGVRKLDPDAAPPSTALGVLGLTGLTAYVGLLDIGQPKEGDTVFVSGAAGAVGSIAGQIAKLLGCRVIGSAGSPEKVAWLRELGFDVAFDYHETAPREALRDEPIDVYFDNVGGDHLEAAIAAARPFARFVECGMISRYNDERPEPGPRNMAMIVGKRLKLQGFIVSDHFDRSGDFFRDMTAWLRDGRVRHRETVVDGLENAPRAFIGLLGGENIGKMLVRLAAPE